MGLLFVWGLVIVAIAIVQIVLRPWTVRINSAVKTILFWILVLAAGVLLFKEVQRTSSVAAARSPVSAHTEYVVVPVGPSVDDVRLALESRANAGWEFTAPVTNNGTTTALIFKREKQ